MQRIEYFDQMKGIAILFVVIGHVLLMSFGTSDNSVFKMLTIFHMPIFFYISGFLAYKHYSCVNDFIKRIWEKTHALLFPYIVFAGIYCLLKHKDFWHFLSVGGAEYWFMYVLFLLTIFFLLFEQLAKYIKPYYFYVTIYILPYICLL